MNTFYQEVEEKSLIPYDEYLQHTVDNNNYFSQNEQQSFGYFTVSGYVGMMRYYDYFEIDLEMPDTCSAWMEMKNENSSREHLDLLSQICDASEDFIDTSDSIDMTLTLYNLPFSDDTKQCVSFYYNRYGGDTSNTNSQYTELAKEISKLLLKSKPTTDPNSLCVYVQWSGRAMGKNHEYIGADSMVYPVTTYSNSIFGTYGDVVYTSYGTAMYVNRNGSIYSYNPSYRTFAPEDEARVWRFGTEALSNGLSTQRGVSEVNEHRRHSAARADAHADAPDRRLRQLTFRRNSSSAERCFRSAALCVYSARYGIIVPELAH